jgi:hypothetical protein
MDFQEAKVGNNTNLFFSFLLSLHYRSAFLCYPVRILTKVQEIIFLSKESDRSKTKRWNVRISEKIGGTTEKSRIKKGSKREI